jgi:hypothetical protein
LRLANLRSLERQLGAPSEEHNHFKTSSGDGKLTDVNVRYWSCGCRALLIDPERTPYSPCRLHGTDCMEAS